MQAVECQSRIPNLPSVYRLFSDDTLVHFCVLPLA